MNTLYMLKYVTALFRCIVAFNASPEAQIIIIFKALHFGMNHFWKNLRYKYMENGNDDLYFNAFSYVLLS